MDRAGRISSDAASFVIELLGSPFRRRGAFSPESIASALYRAILEREPDPMGLADKVHLLRSGTGLEHVIRTFITSAEFQSRSVQTLVPTSPMPDLRASMPERYETQWIDGAPTAVFIARTDSDITLMDSLIDKYRYYDRFGVWSPVIDHDKEITAAIVRGLGARSCLELGCFTGPVLSLLADAGITVLGVEVSHLAFALAYPNIREAMIFGDLLTLDLNRRFDVVLCMDLLEHISPLRLDQYITRILDILDDNGYIYLNSPMWGRDKVFGIFAEPYLEEWLSVGDASYWRHWPCDDKGWPAHGHLVWASPSWWEQKFDAYGLIRDRTVEEVIHRRLAGFFEHTPGRRSLFVLHRRESEESASAVAAEVDNALSNLFAIRQRDSSTA